MDDEAFLRAAGETDQSPEEMVAEEYEREQHLQAEAQASSSSLLEKTTTPGEVPPPPLTEEQNASESSSDSEEEEASSRLEGIVVQNVVATANLKIAIDLKRLTLSARNAEYNPKKFSAVIMRIREPRCTALVFSTGKMVCTGAKSERDARVGARKFAAIIRKIGWEPRFTEFKVQNMVATADVGFPIRLEALVYAHAKFSSYEPELFPGCIYRLVVPKTVLLLFVSGRMVITGAKSRAQLRTAFDKIYPVLCEFQKETLTHFRLLQQQEGNGRRLLPGGPPVAGRGAAAEEDNTRLTTQRGPTTTTTTTAQGVTSHNAGQTQALLPASTSTFPATADTPASGARRLAGAPRVGRSGRRANATRPSPPTPQQTPPS